MNVNKKLRIYEGATAVITGGASGIGRALGQELARRGAEVILADLQVELAQEVAEGIRSRGGKSTAVKLDVTDYPALENVVRETFSRTGRLDYLFNNAGIFLSGGIHQYAIDDWDYILDINVRGVVHGIHAVYPMMRAQGFGHIVNTGSMAGLMCTPGEVAYSMTKHAVVGLSRSLRAQAALLGIRVSVLCPGIIRTEMVESGGKFGRFYLELTPEVRQKLLEKVQPMPADRFAKRALDAVAQNRAIIIEPPWWRWLWRLNRLFPAFSITLMQKFYKRALLQLGLWPPKI